ncbi:MAG: DUF58 domain-containing protein [Chloroflexi bacterium]|nr:DUF58 domain-containing protein [Chloroflexota bacterium]
MPNAAKLILLIIVVYIVANYTRLGFLYQLSYALCAILVISFIWAYLSSRSIQVTRRADGRHAQAGEKFRDNFSVVNSSILPKPLLEIRDFSNLPGHAASLVVRLGSRQSKRWHTETTCRHRGRYTIGPMTLAMGDPFGLFRLAKRIDWTSEVLVYPPILELPGFSIPSGELPGGDLTEHDTQHVTPNAAGVREYAPGDSYNRISWRATARFQRLMVKEFELDPLADTWLILDMDSRAHSAISNEGMSPASSLQAVELEPSSEEYGVAVASSLASMLIGRNHPVGLMSWAQHHEILPPDRGRRQLTKLLETLAIIRAGGKTPLGEMLAAEALRFGRNTSLVIITGSSDQQWLAALQHCLLRGARATAVILDLTTFGGWSDTSALIDALSALGVPTYRIAKGDMLDQALVQNGVRLRA